MESTLIIDNTFDSRWTDDAAPKHRHWETTIWVKTNVACRLATSGLTNRLVLWVQSHMKHEHLLGQSHCRKKCDNTHGTWHSSTWGKCRFIRATFKADVSSGLLFRFCHTWSILKLLGVDWTWHYHAACELGLLGDAFHLFVLQRFSFLHHIFHECQ